MSGLTRDRLIILAAGLMLSPLCFNSFGIDGDGWGMILSGIRLAETGEYIPSRFPGYPLPEYLFAFATALQIHHLTLYIYNLIVFLFSIGTVLVFYSLLPAFDLNKPLYPALAFLFTPLFIINATGPMDYNVSLFFLITAAKTAIDKKYFFSGMMFGLAIASRLSAGPLIIAFIFLIYMSEKEFYLKRSMEFALGILLTSAPFLIVLYYNFGPGFLTYFSDSYPAVSIVTGRLSVRIWGIIGSLFILIILILNLKKVIPLLYVQQGHRVIILFSLIIILLTLIQFFLMPLGSGYLLPMIPFIILIVTKLSGAKQTYLFPLMMFASALLTDIQPSGLTIQGPVINDILTRKLQDYRNSIILDLAKTNHTLNNAIIAGRTAEVLSVHGYLHKNEEPLPENVYDLPGEKEFINLLQKYDRIIILDEAFEAYNDYSDFDVLRLSDRISVYPLKKIKP